jgi:hypothetical protein
VGRSGGIEKTILISLTSEERRARPHMSGTHSRVPAPNQGSARPSVEVPALDQKGAVGRQVGPQGARAAGSASGCSGPK